LLAFLTLVRMVITLRRVEDLAFHPRSL